MRGRDYKEGDDLLMRKKNLLLLLSMLCLFILSSCGKKYAVKFEDFRYNNSISWDTSYSDIVSIYGQPDETKLINGRFTATYNNQSVCGYEGFSVSFEFYYESGALDEIWLRYELPSYNSSARTKIKQVHQAVLEALTSKYGASTDETLSDVPSINHLFFYNEWEGIIEDTRIDIDTEAHVQVSINQGKSDNRGSVCNVVYRCTRDRTKRIQHNDVFPLTPSPVPTASPTAVPPSPTPTINTNGI